MQGAHLLVEENSSASIYPSYPCAVKRRRRNFLKALRPIAGRRERRAYSILKEASAALHRHNGSAGDALAGVARGLRGKVIHARMDDNRPADYLAYGEAVGDECEKRAAVVFK